jgi:hypothetical protein
VDADCGDYRSNFENDADVKQSAAEQQAQEDEAKA